MSNPSAFEESNPASIPFIIAFIGISSLVDVFSISLVLFSEMLLSLEFEVLDSFELKLSGISLSNIFGIEAKFLRFPEQLTRPSISASWPLNLLNAILYQV